MKLKMKCLSKWGIFGMVAVAAVCVMAVILLIFKPWEIRLAEVCAVSLNGEKQLIAVGERVPLELKFTMLDLKKTERIEKKLSETEFVWTSSDNGVATVDSDGTVTGKNTGTALIRVEGGGLMAEYSVEVYRKLEDVTISAAEISANVGEKAKLSYELKPSNADKVGEAIWSS
ncbi:MAG: Ig-like domain-containing protein, partial [Lachnospiraceae bacterium]|nr:Ig-like domain-containing protein [Lachnospiraceae bacterium]